MEMITVNGESVVNNLCPSCAAHLANGVLDNNIIHVLKLNDAISMAVCVHSGECSVLDMGRCPCGHVGFLETPDTQNGICKERNEFVYNLEIVSSGTEKGTYCPTCEADQCDLCGGNTRSHTTIKLSGGRTVSVCANCASDYTICIICGEVHTKYNDNLARFICDDCAPNVHLCMNCGNIVKSDEVTTVGDRTYCKHCYKETACAYCGVYTHSFKVDQYWVCKDHVNILEELPHIDDYGHTPGRIFHAVKNENPKAFFGVENEVQLDIRTEFLYNSVALKKRIVAKHAQDCFDDVETKRDGSLCGTGFQGNSTNNGVELVWQPMSYAWFNSKREVFKEMFTHLTPMLDPNMNESGMHIHINKQAFTPLALRKFMEFFFNPVYQPLLYHISGRRVNDYACLRSYTVPKGTKHTPTTSYAQALTISQFKRSKHHHLDADRYDIVNTTNSNTYEVRIFKGCNEYTAFMYRVEFIAALVEFVSNCCINYTSDDFIRYVLMYGKRYPELAKHLKVFVIPSDFVPDTANGNDDCDSDDYDNRFICSSDCDDDF